MNEAMILSAGFSTRLRPLTNDIPKSMLPFLHSTQFDYSLAYLKHFGINRFSTNVCHGKDLFLKFLKNYPDVTPFVEDPILGTGGGIYNMQSFVKGEHFAVINCDFVCNIDLKKAFEFHKKNKALATLVLVEQHSNKYGSVTTNNQNKIKTFEKIKDTSEGPSHFFSGIHIIDKKLFDFKVNKKMFCIIRDVYEPLIAQGRSIMGYQTDEWWTDTGELKEYKESQREFSQRPLPLWAIHLFKGLKT